MADNKLGSLAALLLQPQQSAPVTANPNMLAQALRSRNKPEFQMQPNTLQGLLDAGALATSPVPVLGDLIGIGADGYRFATDPSSRTPANFGLAALGLLPFVPAAGAAAGLFKGSAGPSMGGNQLGAINYHGSPKNFNAFDLSAPKTTGGAFNKHGVSISPNEKVANRYASDFEVGGNRGTVYKLDFEPQKELSLENRDFHTLQRYVGEIDSGRGLNEVQAIGLEEMLRGRGIEYTYGKSHPIDAIKSSGHDSISSKYPKNGAFYEAERLVFDPEKIKILGKKPGPGPDSM